MSAVNMTQLHNDVDSGEHRSDVPHLSRRRWGQVYCEHYDWSCVNHTETWQRDKRQLDYYRFRV